VTTMVPVIAVRYRDYLQHSPTLGSPGKIEVTLSPATYVIFEHPASLGPYDCSSPGPCVTIGPTDVSVISVTGVHEVIYTDPSNEAITDSSDHYYGAVKFDVREVGTYSVSVHSSIAASFVVAKQPSEEVVALLGWISAAAVGFFLTATALAGSVMSRGRRRRNQRI
jgi:hypothetical protein